jgi:hypothetical protein
LGSTTSLIKCPPLMAQWGAAHLVDSLGVDDLLD